MKTVFVLCVFGAFIFANAGAQVTQINSNQSLHVVFPLSLTKTILVSDIDSSLWVTDATLPGTIQISVVKYEGYPALLGGKMIFRGRTGTTDSEIYSTDGTAGGTGIIKDIYAGVIGSRPAEMLVMGGFVYFNATTAAEGRELWRTNGLPAGTTLVKDIVPGTDSSNREGDYNLYTNGSYLLFAARTPATGVELWKSDGTAAGTDILMDINTGNAGADSSNPWSFYGLNGLVLFAAKDATHGEEIWKTNGTPGGTTILKDINTGTANSTSFELFPGLDLPVFQAFHGFNNKAYFNVTDGASTGELWSTDGTTLNTGLVKDVVPGLSFSFVSVIQAVNYPNKFIFPVSDGTSSELWVSDGTTVGTVPFYSFDPVNAGAPFIFIPYDLSGGPNSYALFQGNKFFFTAGTMTEGNELWITDGTDGGTHMVKDIYAGVGDGIDLSTGLSYLYTSTALFFKGTTSGQGDELWRTDGTTIGTNIVADIYTGTGGSEPELTYLCNGNKIIFPATNGDDPQHSDLYVVDGEFGPIPVTITGFTVELKGNDALLKWNTAQEINSRDFMIQRSNDALQFETIGMLAAAGNSSNSRAYSFIDKGVTGLKKELVYYRFIASDLDGKETYSNVLPLKLKNAVSWELKLMVNPVQHELKLFSTGITGAVKIVIRDLNGKPFYSNNLENMNEQSTIPVNFPAGVYILLAEHNNEVKVIKFVKQ